MCPKHLSEFMKVKEMQQLKEKKKEKLWDSLIGPNQEKIGSFQSRGLTGDYKYLTNKAHLLPIGLAKVQVNLNLSSRLKNNVDLLHLRSHVFDFVQKKSIFSLRKSKHVHFFQEG